MRIRAPIEEIRMLLDIPEGETERMSANQNAVEPKTEENPDDTVEIIESVNLLEMNKERTQDRFTPFSPLPSTGWFRFEDPRKSNLVGPKV